MTVFWVDFFHALNMDTSVILITKEKIKRVICMTVVTDIVYMEKNVEEILVIGDSN